MTRFIFALTGSLAAMAVAAQTFVVAPELWDRPRSGKTVLEQPSVRQAVSTCLAQPGSRLVVRHGPGQEAFLAAEELRTWLAALAIEPARVELRGDLKPGEPLQIEMVRDVTQRDMKVRDRAEHGDSNHDSRVPIH